MKKVCVLVLDGAMRSSVAITLDILETANRLGTLGDAAPPFDVVLCEVDVASSAAAELRVETSGSDLIIVPGLGVTDGRELEARLERVDAREAGRFLSLAAASGIELATSCSGTFLLASHGLLAHKRATTTWWLSPLFRRMYPDTILVSDEIVVRDGNVTTAGAAMAQTDLLLDIVARHSYPSLADQCAQYMVLDRRRSQSPYMSLQRLTRSDTDVARARNWALMNLSAELQVADVAAAVGMSTRTFARRVHHATGLSPVRFLRRLRVERAVELLDLTDATVENITRDVGYRDATTLRRAMHRELGASPRSVRASLLATGRESSTL